MVNVWGRRTRTARRLVFLFAFLPWTAFAEAQELPWAQRMFGKVSHDFGVVARGAEATHRFKVTSLWRDDTHIASVTTSCGCTAATVGKRTLKSHESTHIEVTMDTNRFTYQKDSSVTVTFDAPLYAEVRIPIRAYILPDVTLTPGAVDFGKPEYGTGAERTIRVSRAGSQNWTIKEVKSTSEYVTGRVVEVGRSGGAVSYDLHAALKPTAPVGSLRGQILLVTDDPWTSTISVLTEAQIEADVTVTPRVLSLGILKPGQQKSAQLVLRMKKPFVIERVEYATEADSTQVDSAKGTKAVHVVPVIVKAPEEPGKFTGELTITIGGRPQPVTVKTYGSVVDESPE